jgi:hypothetical protein
MVLFDSQHEISTQLQLIAFRFVVSGNKFEAAVSATIVKDAVRLVVEALQLALVADSFHGRGEMLCCLVGNRRVSFPVADDGGWSALVGLSGSLC